MSAGYALSALNMQVARTDTQLSHSRSGLISRLWRLVPSAVAVGGGVGRWLRDSRLALGMSLAQEGRDADMTQKAVAGPRSEVHRESA